MQHKWTAYTVEKWKTHNILPNNSMNTVQTKPVHNTDTVYGCVHDTPAAQSWAVHIRANANSVTWLNAHVPGAEYVQRGPTSMSFSSLPLTVVNHPKLMGTLSASAELFQDLLTTIIRKHPGILTRSLSYFTIISVPMWPALS
jgi:hypothetical protein